MLLETPAQVGRQLDINATLQAIQSGLLAGEHNIPITVVTANPIVGDDATAASLGITKFGLILDKLFPRFE